MARKHSVKRRKVLFDPEDLQLMDECNKPWVHAWKRATSCSDLIKVLITSNGTPEKVEET